MIIYSSVIQDVDNNQMTVHYPTYNNFNRVENINNLKLLKTQTLFPKNE